MKIEFDGSDYAKYRGKCKESSLLAVEKDPTLRLVRGFYFCPIWNWEEEHWWTVRENGRIFDPSAGQFPSKGHGVYREFDGTVECEECGKVVDEGCVIMMWRHPVCSMKCGKKLVGLY